MGVPPSWTQNHPLSQQDFRPTGQEKIVPKILIDS